MGNTHEVKNDSLMSEIYLYNGIREENHYNGIKVIRCCEYGKFAVVNNTNKVIVPFGKYSFIDGFDHGYARVNKEFEDGTKKWGIIDTSGNVVVPLHYDTICNFLDKNRETVRMYKNDTLYWFDMLTGQTSLKDPWYSHHGKYYSAPRYDDDQDEREQMRRDAFYALTDGTCGDYEDWSDDGYKDYMGL